MWFQNPEISSQTDTHTYRHTHHNTLQPVLRAKYQQWIASNVRQTVAADVTRETWQPATDQRCRRHHRWYQRRRPEWEPATLSPQWYSDDWACTARHKYSTTMSDIDQITLLSATHVTSSCDTAQAWYTLQPFALSVRLSVTLVSLVKVVKWFPTIQVFLYRIRRWNGVGVTLNRMLNGVEINLGKYCLGQHVHINKPFCSPADIFL